MPSAFDFINPTGPVEVIWSYAGQPQESVRCLASISSNFAYNDQFGQPYYWWYVNLSNTIFLDGGTNGNQSTIVSLLGGAQAGATEQGLLLAKNNAAGVSSTFVTDNLHYNNNTEVLYSKNTKTQILEVQKFQEWNGTDVGTSNQVIMADGSGGWSWQTLTSTNASDLKDSDNPAIKRLVGAEGELGAAFGLDNEWSLRIIEQVGNYGESYKKHIADTGILPNRGPNQLWTKGGILYVPPAR